MARARPDAIPPQPLVERPAREEAEETGRQNRLRRLASALAGADPAWWVVALMVVVWIAVFGPLVYQRHDRFGSFGFDMGIFDQAIWLLSRFDGQFITVRGLPVFGHHANFGFYLFVPFYWLGAGPHFVNLVQVGSLALGAVPLFLIARDRLGYGWIALPLVAAYLLHPSPQFMAWELLHPETMAITPLLFAYWFAMRRRWWWFALCCVVAVSWKEDVALAVFALGILVAVRGHRKVGLITAGLSLAWIGLVTRVMLPFFSGHSAFYISFFFYDLGKTPPEMVVNIVRNPSLLTRRLVAPDAKSYMLRMLVPYGFLPLLAPGVLLIGIPQLLINLLSVNNYTRVITFHYAALPLTALTLATVEGVARVGVRPGLRRFLVGLVAASALAATVGLGLSPIGSEYRKGWWPGPQDPRRAAKEHALAMVPPTASVSATYQFVPHLTHRKQVYEFPSPFVPHYWGVDNKNPPDPRAAEWLVIDTALTGAEDRKVLDRALAGEYAVRYERDGVLVARRVRSAARPGP